MALPLHRWMHPTPRIRVDGTRIERNDEFYPTAHEMHCWPHRMTEVTGTCDAIKEDGEVCGRERPCQYHDWPTGDAPDESESEE